MSVYMGFNKTIYDVIIIGGGAAGCIAAIAAAKLYKNALIIEKNNKLAKKIYVTGNGKCNFTNENQKIEFYRSNHPEKAWNIINQFNKDKTLDFFKNIGILPKNKNGYYYPNSEQASSVASALALEIKKYGVTVLYQTTVNSIEEEGNLSLGYNEYKADKDSILSVNTSNGNCFGKSIIIAAGGMASPVHGSDGSGYRLAEQIGHKVTDIFPALTQLKGKGTYFKTISGVRLEGCGSLYINQKMITAEHGEFLFTAYGISGIPVFQMSRFAAIALHHKQQVQLVLDFFPDICDDVLYQYLLTGYECGEHKTAEEVLWGIINYKLAFVILKELKIDPVISAKQVSNKSIKQISDILKHFTIEITAVNDFENAQVTSGGISLEEVDNDTLESLKMPGVYFAGEILDVDGTCGGYNLQWAWSSGYVAGVAAAKREKKF